MGASKEYVSVQKTWAARNQTAVAVMMLLAREMKSRTQTLLVIACMSARPSVGHAQAADPHTVQPERPSVATHAGTVAPGWFEIEFGSEFDRYAHDSHGVAVPITGKIGLASHVQLSMLGSGVSPPGSGMTIGDFAVGVKWRLSDNAPV